MKHNHIKFVIIFICLIQCEPLFQPRSQSTDPTQIQESGRQKKFDPFSTRPGTEPPKEWASADNFCCDQDCAPENCQCSRPVCYQCGVDGSPDDKYLLPLLCNDFGNPDFDFDVDFDPECWDSCGRGGGGSCTGSSPEKVSFCKDPSKDNCNYKAGEMCGDTCQHSLDDCSCGGKSFNIRTSQEFCCNGKNQNLSEPCQGLNGPTCYNSYQDSQFLGYNAHFYCPESCVPILDMCQGISWCEEDVKVCNENLKVPSSIQFQSENTFYGQLVEKKNLSIAPRHHYNIQNAGGKINNDQYDVFDRSDEDLIEAKVESIDFTKFHFCKDWRGNAGVQCDDSECIPRNEWCNDSPKKVCGDITTGNDIVCSNYNFWKDFPCPFNDTADPFDPFYFEGQFCPGRPGQCYTPWYRRSDANIQLYVELKVLSRSCIEKSDQVFALNQACPNRTQYHKKGLSIFCQCLDNGVCTPKIEHQFVPNLKICQNINDFPDTINDWIDDPHNCWGSCSEPGENCMACSNADYFTCPISKVCIINMYSLIFKIVIFPFPGLHSSRLEVRRASSL